MRSLLRVAVFLALLVPLPAAAQLDPGLGLDLTDDAAKKEEEAPKPAPVLPPAAAPKKEEAREVPKLTEAEIAAEDRVKSVQRKPFLRYHRLELTPMAFMTVNDAYFPKFGPGARAAWYIQDNLGIGLRFFQYNLIPSDNIRLAKRQLQSRLPSVLPKTSVSVDLLWSVIYGKVSLFNSIRHFDIYLIGGVDALYTQTSNVDGMHLGTHLGFGQRFAISRFMTVDLSIVEALYSDRPQAGNKAIVQHALSLNGGVSFYLPTGFDYRER